MTYPHTQRLRIALLGTGTMGAPMARNLAIAGSSVVAWNRTRSKAEALAGDGIRVAATPAEATAEADVVVTMLADADAVEAAMLGPDGGLANLPAGALWAQMSTVGVVGAERLESLARDRGVHFVDAPVLGSREPAESGTLIVLASGPDHSCERCAQVFDVVGARTLWLGPGGAGSRLKVVVNAWLMSTTAALAETIVLAEILEVNPESFLEVTGHGALGALYTDLNASSMVERSFPSRFPLALALKDTMLALEGAGAAGELPVLAATRDQFARAVELGHGERDWAAVIYAALGEGLRAPAGRG